MTPVRFGLVVLPAVAFALTVYAVRPVTPAVAPRRLAVVRGAVVVGAFGVLAVEGLSAAGWLTAAGIGIAWGLGVAAAGFGAWLRFKKAQGDASDAGPRTAP